jgi:hypothetical protein
MIYSEFNLDKEFEEKLNSWLNALNGFEPYMKGAFCTFDDLPFNILAVFPHDSGYSDCLTVYCDDCHATEIAFVYDNDCKKWDACVEKYYGGEE